MAKFQDYFKIVTPKPNITTMTDSQSIGDQGVYANYTWYQRLIQGSASRIARYREYDLMDNDVEIARSLDTIAEEMIGSDPNSELPLELVIDGEKENGMSSSTVKLLRIVLRYWIDLHDWHIRLFKVARVTIKYGDCFFIRNKETTKWEYIHPKNVVAAIVDDRDMTRVMGWQIRREIKTPNSPYNQSVGHYGNFSTENVDTYLSDDVVWFTLNDDIGEAAPFGESVLRAVYRAQKQKELLEDAILIYRIQRAPERRVFYIDVGKMPPQRVKSYLEEIKNEIRQRKIPSFGGGVDQVDSVYNPQCLALDTMIPLLDGRTLTLSELISEYQIGKQNWAYSINPETGETIPGIITWAGVTKRDAQVIRLTFDNGEQLVCTPDHKIPVRGKGDIQAKDLTFEDSLFPCELKKESDKSVYTQIYDTSTQKWIFVHKMVAEYMRSKNQLVDESIGQSIHHIDLDINNNNPDNLVFKEYTDNNDSEHLTEESLNLNHRVIKIEWLDEKIDVGTLTIEGQEKLHNHHYFAVFKGVFVKNSMFEDFFFASRPDSKGSRVETLPGGQGLDHLSDLEYFQWKVFRGLRIPLSYMREGQDNAVFNDGKTGVAYIQELRFAMYIKRLQNYISRVMDQEFKRYVRQTGVGVDATSFHVKLPDPENFGIFRQQQLDSDLLNTYGQANGVEHLSKRFTMQKYLQLTDEEISVNERLRAEELGLDPDNLTKEDFIKLYAPASTEGGLGAPGMMAGTLGPTGFGDTGMGGIGDAGLGGVGEPASPIGGVGGGADNLTPPNL